MVFQILYQWKEEKAGNFWERITTTQKHSKQQARVLDALSAAPIPACPSLASACFLCCICFVWKRGPRLDVAPGSLLLCQKSDWCSKASFYLLITSRTNRCPFFQGTKNLLPTSPNTWTFRGKLRDLHTTSALIFSIKAKAAAVTSLILGNKGENS